LSPFPALPAEPLAHTSIAIPSTLDTKIPFEVGVNIHHMGFSRDDVPIRSGVIPNQNVIVAHDIGTPAAIT
jgi:hypothetical protein